MTLSPADAKKLIEIARGAGLRILPYFQRPQTQGKRKKKDDSPLTDADMAAHDYILEALARDFPGIPVISEEDELSPSLLEANTFFLVDPLDGTRSFVRGEDEFTVNIGLIEDSSPVWGVIHTPVQGIAYSGGMGRAMRHEGDSAMVIHVRSVPKEGLTIARSRSAPSPAAKTFLQSLPVHEIISASSAVKLCWVAEGAADVYPRFGRTMEWDTAAGHAIVEAAGGRMTTLDGQPFFYKKAGFENPGFIAWGGYRPL